MLQPRIKNTFNPPHASLEFRTLSLYKGDQVLLHPVDTH